MSTEFSRSKGKLVEHFAAEGFTFDGEPPSLVIVKELSFLSELLPENAILRQEIFGGILLPSLDPAGEDQEQQLPWLQKSFHVPPDACLRSGASGIGGDLSRVASSVRLSGASHSIAAVCGSVEFFT
jgi:hypothetical protein